MDLIKKRTAAGFRSAYLISLCFLVSVLFLIKPHQALASDKAEMLRKYEHVIVKSNQMNLAGYDLQEITFKLKRLTEVILDNQLEQADRLLDEITKELKVIEARGPEHLRRERRLVWLEVYGDLMQQLAIFIVMALILLRFSFVKRAMLLKAVGWRSVFKLAIAFAVASIISASFGLIRYGQSSWSFVDLQVLWVGISGLVGGLWVGLISGFSGVFFRSLIAPEFGVYLAIPVVVGCMAGIFHWFSSKRPLGRLSTLAIGLVIGLVHSLFMYVPIRPYLPWYSFVYAIIFLSLAEGGVIVLFFVLARQIFKEEKRKETERELFRTRLQFLQAQINPHFLFNTLNTIAAVCGEERAERARDLIIQLSTFFRRLTKQERDMVSLQDEFEYIDAYLNIEKARFGDRLRIEKQVRLSAGALNSQVPVLVLQPIVENAVKHGLSKKSEGGTIAIRASETDSSVKIEVQDTGVGMSEEVQRSLFSGQDHDSADRSDHTGIGLGNIRERMDRLFGDGFQLSLVSAPDQGTTVTIVMPKTAG